MENYCSNSYKSKAEVTAPIAEKKIQKVVSGKVTTKKKSAAHKLLSMLVAEDIPDMKTYVFTDILIPAVRNTLWDIVTDSANAVFGGGKSGKKRRPSDYIAYDRFSDPRSSRRRESGTPKSRDNFDYDDIEFDNRGDAEAVLDQMAAVIKQYGLVTVLDLYDMVELTAPYTADKYGWTSVRNAETVRVRGGKYILKLPKASPIDDD